MPYSVVVCSNEFPDHAIEREILAPIGAELVDATRVPDDQVRRALATADGALTEYWLMSRAQLAEMPRCKVIDPAVDDA